jgi:hypothetical protein
MKQSKLMSFVESLINIAVGLGVAMAANAIILPLMGFPISFRENAIIAAFMTVVSIARSFTLRRIFEALHIRRPLSPFMQAVIAERFRQVEVEGWTAENDDFVHLPGDLALHGGLYAQYAHLRPSDYTPPSLWRWNSEWWKPVDFRRNLVKAAALILAEGEKHDRNRSKRSDWDHPRPLGHGHQPASGPKPKAPTTGSGVTARKAVS